MSFGVSLCIQLRCTIAIDFRTETAYSFFASLARVSLGDTFRMIAIILETANGATDGECTM
jgi:hypothetical protein